MFNHTVKHMNWCSLVFCFTLWCRQIMRSVIIWLPIFTTEAKVLPVSRYINNLHSCPITISFWYAPYIFFVYYLFIAGDVLDYLVIGGNYWILVGDPLTMNRNLRSAVAGGWGARTCVFAFINARNLIFLFFYASTYR